MKNIDIEERIELLRAMDCIMRHMNDEEVIMTWLEVGIPDGACEDDDDCELIDIAEDNGEFSEIMDTFVNLMQVARNEPLKGTLYCDGVCNGMEE